MKLLFFDIDGTIMGTDAEHTIPQSTKDAIAQARKNGHKAFINSGRCLSYIKEGIRSIGFDGYVCGCGSQVIIEGKPVFHTELSHDVCKKIALLVKQNNVFCTLEGSKAMYVCEDGEVWHLIGEHWNTRENGDAADIDDLNFVFDKVTIWNYDEVCDEIKEIVEKYFWIMTNGKAAIEFGPKNCSKGTGMQKVAEHYGLTLDDCVAFGDYLNDIPMIEAAGISVSMGTCSEVDNVAAFVTKPLEEDGIYYAMKHYDLI